MLSMVGAAVSARVETMPLSDGATTTRRDAAP
jgi:hypothetical protein